MFLTIVSLILLTIGSGTRGNQVFSSSGTHFVIAVPQSLYTIDSCTIYVTTSEMKATLKIQKPESMTLINTKRKEESFTIKRYSSFRYPLTNRDYMDSNNIFNAIIMKANVPVRAFVQWLDTVEGENGNAETFNLFHKQICFGLIYMVTYFGSPFIAVIAFDEGASLQVTFPEFPTTFEVDCAADKKCAPGQTVSVTLAPYRAWYFLLNDKDKDGVRYDLHNTLVNSDKPVFAISGNLVCQRKEKDPIDLCLTTPKPVRTWGKEFLVPTFSTFYYALLYLLRFNSETFPFEYKFWLQTERKDYLESEIITARNNLFMQHLSPIYGPMILRSNITFSVSVYMECYFENIRLSSALFIVVPTEQWTQGTFRSTVLDARFKQQMNIFMGSTSKDVYKPFGKNETLDLLTLCNYTYNWIKDDGVWSLTPKDNGRLIVYLAHWPKRDAFTLRSLDPLQAPINNPNCSKSDPTPSDGVDNDCDGTTDEEIQDGKDDDEDGEVDEDTILAAGGKSTWTSWRSCDVTCGGKKLVRKYRSCKTALFSENCAGVNENCKPGPSCPEDCDDINNQTCACLTNCEKCDVNDGVCEECKAGFAISDYCLGPCPRGWSGVGCTVLGAEKNKKEDSSDENETKNDKNTTNDGGNLTISGATNDENLDNSKPFPVFSVLIPLCLLMLMGVVLILALVKRRKSKGLETEKEGAEDDGEGDEMVEQAQIEEPKAEEPIHEQPEIDTMEENSTHSPKLGEQRSEMSV